LKLPIEVSSNSEFCKGNIYMLRVRDINLCLLGNGPIYLLSKARRLEKEWACSFWFVCCLLNPRESMKL